MSVQSFSTTDFTNPAQQTLNAASTLADDTQIQLNTGVISRLGHYVRNSFENASRHKKMTVLQGGVSVEEKMLQCLRMMQGVDDPGVKNDVPIYINLAQVKGSNAAAWVKDTYGQAESQPWTLEPTPIPATSQVGKQAAIQALLVEVRQSGLPVASLPPDMIKKRLLQLEDAVLGAERKEAAAAVKRMSDLIADQMAEGKFETEFDAFTESIATYPYAVFKAPCVESRHKLRWNGNELVSEFVPTMTFRNINPFDFYWSPDSTDTQNGQYVIEKCRNTKDALASCINLPNYSRDAIEMVINKFKNGYVHIGVGSDSERRALERTGQGNVGGGINGDNTIESLVYSGWVDGELMLEWCSQEQVDPVDTFGQEIDPAMSYQAEIEVVDTYVIRALLNPTPDGSRPYHKACWRNTPGSFAGESPVSLCHDLQKLVNSTVRKLVKNSAYSSGPIVEINLDGLDDEQERPNAIQPYGVYYTRNTGIASNRAMNFDKVPSVASELLGVLRDFWQRADEVTGIPAHSYGSAQGALKQVGSFAMQLQGALRGVKQAMSNIDYGVITPIVSQIYVLNLLTSPDQSIKADASVVARGAKGLLGKEVKAARSIEVMQTLVPLLSGGLIPPQGIQTIIRDWLDLSGFNSTSIFGDQAANEQMGQLGGELNMNQGPQLDGRSGAAMQAMDQMQPFGA